MPVGALSKDFQFRHRLLKRLGPFNIGLIRVKGITPIFPVNANNDILGLKSVDFNICYGLASN